MKTTECGRCGRQIAWARTTNGKSMPVDPEPRANGNVFCQYEGGVLVARVKSKTDPTPPGTPMVAHFLTCGPQDKPAPAPKPTPPEEPTLF